LGVLKRRNVLIQILAVNHQLNFYVSSFPPTNRRFDLGDFNTLTENLWQQKDLTIKTENIFFI